jgi:hypothetical protein
MLVEQVTTVPVVVLAGSVVQNTLHRSMKISTLQKGMSSAFQKSTGYKNILRKKACCLLVELQIYNYLYQCNSYKEKTKKKKMMMMNNKKRSRKIKR